MKTADTYEAHQLEMRNLSLEELNKACDAYNDSVQRLELMQQPDWRKYGRYVLAEAEVAAKKQQLEELAATHYKKYGV